MTISERQQLKLAINARARRRLKKLHGAAWRERIERAESDLMQRHGIMGGRSR